MIMLGGQTDLPASVSALELRSSFPGDEGLDGVDNDPSAGSPQWCILTGGTARAGSSPHVFTIEHGLDCTLTSASLLIRQLERRRDNFAVSEPESYAIMAHLDSRLRITLTSRVDYHWVRPLTEVSLPVSRGVMVSKVL